MTLLHLAGVTRTVQLVDAPPLTILSGVDLDVAVGDRVSIVGRSGSGKSTLLNLLGLLDNPTSGDLEFDGRPVRSFSHLTSSRSNGGETTASPRSTWPWVICSTEQPQNQPFGG